MGRKKECFFCGNKIKDIPVTAYFPGKKTGTRIKRYFCRSLCLEKARNRQIANEKRKNI